MKISFMKSKFGLLICLLSLLILKINSAHLKSTAYAFIPQLSEQIKQSQNSSENAEHFLAKMYSASDKLFKHGQSFSEQNTNLTNDFNSYFDKYQNKFESFVEKNKNLFNNMGMLRGITDELLNQLHTKFDSTYKEINSTESEYNKKYQEAESKMQN